MLTRCRRCGTCANSRHHWIADPQPDVIGEYACKHCEIRGEECAGCGGDGCDVCGGEGVIPVIVLRGDAVTLATAAMEWLQAFEGKSVTRMRDANVALRAAVCVFRDRTVSAG